MPAKRYIVTLTENEQTQLQALVHQGRAHAFRRRAQIWLQVDAGPQGPGRTDTDTAEILGVGVSTVERARRAFTHQGLTEALQPPAPIKLACSPAPAGSSGWTLQVVESIGRETVRVALKKTGCSLESPQLVPEDGAR